MSGIPAKTERVLLMFEETPRVGLGPNTVKGSNLLAVFKDDPASEIDHWLAEPLKAAGIKPIKVQRRDDGTYHAYFHAEGL